MIFLLTILYIEESNNTLYIEESNKLFSPNNTLYIEES